MDYSQLYKLDIQKYFVEDIAELRQCFSAKNKVIIFPELKIYKLWEEALLIMLDRDVLSRSTCEFLRDEYLPVDGGLGDNKTNNHKLISLVLLKSLVIPLVPQEVAFSAELLSTLMAQDIATTIRINFKDYGVVATSYSAKNNVTVFTVTAKK